MLSENDVLELLRGRGLDVPPSRFAKWRENGLVPTTGRPGLGQGKGRAPHRYPEAAVEQAAAIDWLLAKGLDFEEVGWRLWVAGCDVARHYWFDVFATVAKEFDEHSPVFRGALDSDELEANPIEEMADKLYEADTNNRLIKSIRKSLGRERFSTFLFQIAQMATGQFTAITTVQDPKSRERQADLRAMDIALGLSHARSDIINGVGPIISGDYSSSLGCSGAP